MLLLDDVSIPVHAGVEAVSEESPIGDPSCPVCKACICYNTCFSGMEGFPKTSSNFGRGQNTCVLHIKKCGKTHTGQAKLEEFFI